MSLAPDALQPAAEVEPFWQRVHRFFALPFDRAVLARIGGLAAWGVLALALFFLGALGVIVGLVALLAMLVVGARYGFKIIERSSRGYLQPSAYPLSDEDLVREMHSLHRTRDDAVRHGPEDALRTHDRRSAELEAEYLRRFPDRELIPRDSEERAGP